MKHDVGDQYEIHPVGQLSLAKLDREKYRHDCENVCDVSAEPEDEVFIK